MHPRSEIRETYTLQKAAEKQCQAPRSTHCWGNSFHIHKTFALSNSAMSILNLRLSVTVWWVADKMSTIFSREFVSINTVQQQELHTRSFSCQKKKKKGSIFLLLLMGAGKGKCIIYINAFTRAV